MSIDVLLNNYVRDNNVIITSAPGNGSTSLVQAIMDRLCLDQPILYYSPPGMFDREFVKEHYKNAFENVCFMSGEIRLFIEYLTLNILSAEPFKYIVIDPADCLLTFRDVFIHINSALAVAGSNLICTSQIRCDLDNGGQLYSTIGRWNKLYAHNCTFKYSIWVRNVTGVDPFHDSKYADVFPMFRTGNKYLDRYIVKFQKKEGHVVA